MVWKILIIEGGCNTMTIKEQYTRLWKLSESLCEMTPKPMVFSNSWIGGNTYVIGVTIFDEERYNNCRLICTILIDFDANTVRFDYPCHHFKGSYGVLDFTTIDNLYSIVKNTFRNAIEHTRLYFGIRTESED